MTNYGTIPTSHAPYASTPEFLTTARQHLTARRPWQLFLSPTQLALPTSFPSALSRAQSNLSFFRVNYAIVSLFILFCSLLWHPVSLIIFLLALSAWLFLYFLRDSPVLLFGRTVDDRIVLAGLTVLTLVVVLFTGVAVNVVAAVAVAVVVVVVHAVFHRGEDGGVGGVDGYDDAGVGGGSGGGYSRIVGGLGERLPLKDTASSSFSAS